MATDTLKQRLEEEREHARTQLEIDCRQLSKRALDLAAAIRDGSRVYGHEVQDMASCVKNGVLLLAHLERWLKK